MKYKILIIFPFLILQAGFSQVTNQFSLNPHYGFIIPHHSFIEYLVNDHITAIELNYKTRNTGKAEWDSIYHNIERGYGLTYSTLGNNAILGKSLSIFGFYNFRILEIGQRISLVGRTSIGMGYASKTFDLYENYNNLAISSHINAHVNLGMEFYYQINNTFELTAGGRLSHLSNGKLSSPNYGINIFTGFAGINYTINERRSNLSNPISQEKYKKWFHDITFSGGGTTISAYQGGIYPIASLAYKIQKQYRKKGSISMGVDYFYNSSNEPKLEEEARFKWPDKINTFSNADNSSIGLSAGHEFCHLKLRFGLYMGSYLKSTLHGTGGLYHRLGLKYEVNKNIYLNLTLKTHWAVAEFIEWGIGIRL